MPMPPLARTLIDVVEALSDRFAFSLVGGLAVSLYIEPRFTRDLDIAIAVEHDEEAEQALGYLERAGYRVDSAVEHPLSRRLTTVRLSRASGEGRVDALFAA